MKKTLTLVAIIAIFSLSVNAQAKKDTTVFAPTQKQVNEFVDSVMAKVSLKEFDIWVADNASPKMLREGTYLSFLSLFVQPKVDAWVASKNKPKK